MQNYLSDIAKVKGTATACIYELESDEAVYWGNLLGSMHNASPRAYYEASEAFKKSARLVRTHHVHNLVVTTGLATLAAYIAGETTYSGGINYGALGSGSTAPVAGNTQLGTETFRKLYATRSRVGAVTTIEYFYNTSQANGTHNEFGCFIAGTGTANSGQLYNRLLTGGWTKTGTQTMTVSIQQNITI